MPPHASCHPLPCRRHLHASRRDITVKPRAASPSAPPPRRSTVHLLRSCDFFNLCRAATSRTTILFPRHLHLPHIAPRSPPSNQRAPPPFAKGPPLLKPPSPSRAADRNLQRTSPPSDHASRRHHSASPPKAATTKLRFTFITINTIASSSSPQQSQSRFRPGRHQRASSPQDLHLGFSFATGPHSKTQSPPLTRTCKQQTQKNHSGGSGNGGASPFPKSETLIGQGRGQPRGELPLVRPPLVKVGQLRGFLAISETQKGLKRR
ncbi:hypothetical protein LR48_Vigan10g073000 [Vigna angularis]|uniref:Uncharacterized protein n=1 Tax=Phaseolus angularis TaxID=3914 RepID=A0A0L9VIM5_PHAAN|nr:hypothetical protein LR48_Vigan10g073000 [Vigna angularis]